MFCNGGHVEYPVVVEIVDSPLHIQTGHRATSICMTNCWLCTNAKNYIYPVFGYRDFKDVSATGAANFE